ncbi:hypothetical protein T09_2636 [Trichinella sp. T9]|nr:hypothetical protein T09_2636 [Trichinella sp. T9]
MLKEIPFRGFDALAMCNRNNRISFKLIAVYSVGLFSKVKLKEAVLLPICYLLAILRLTAYAIYVNTLEQSPYGLSDREYHEKF